MLNVDSAMAPKLTLYYMPVSPASRAVVLLAKAINIDLELKQIDISRGEQMTPEFLKVGNCDLNYRCNPVTIISIYYLDKSSAHTSSPRRFRNGNHR